MNKRNPISKSFVFLLVSILFYQCYEPVDGCLDPLATNYNVSADDACEDCCTNPELKINFRMEFNNTSVARNAWVEYSDGDTIAIQSLELSLSSFYMLDGDLNILRTEDSVVHSGATYFKDLFFINSNPQNIDAFSFRYLGAIKEIGFSTGIPQNIQNPNVNISIPNLEEIRDSMWNEDLGNMAQLKFRYILKDSVLQEDLVFLDLLDDVISFPVDTLTEKATDLSYNLNLNLNNWWTNIDFKTDSPADIKSNLEDNLIGSFELE